MPRKAAWPRLICPQKPVIRFSESANSTLIAIEVSREISYSMYLSPREQALRAHHQHRDQEGEGDGIAVEQLAEINRAERFDHAENQCGEQRAAHRTHAAQHDDCQPLVGWH